MITKEDLLRAAASHGLGACEFLEEKSAEGPSGPVRAFRVLHGNDVLGTLYAHSANAITFASVECDARS